MVISGSSLDCSALSMHVRRITEKVGQNLRQNSSWSPSETFYDVYLGDFLQLVYVNAREFGATLLKETVDTYIWMNQVLICVFTLPVKYVRPLRMVHENYSFGDLITPNRLEELVLTDAQIKAIALEKTSFSEKVRAAGGPELIFE